jgi:hypothetical protein
VLCGPVSYSNGLTFQAPGTIKINPYKSSLYGSGGLPEVYRYTEQEAGKYRMWWDMPSAVIAFVDIVAPKKRSERSDGPLSASHQAFKKIRMVRRRQLNPISAIAPRLVDGNR